MFFFYVYVFTFFKKRTRADCTQAKKYVHNCPTLAYPCFQSQNNKTFQGPTSIQVAVQPYSSCFRIFLKPCITFDIFRRFLSQTAKAIAYKLHSTFSIWGNIILDPVTSENTEGLNRSLRSGH